MEAVSGKAPPPEPAAPADPRIHKWASRLVSRLKDAGVRTSDVLLTTSKFGYRSAYFAVPGIGEIRVSDHPLNDAHPTSEISISSPVSFHDLATAYAYAHNKYHSRKLAVLAHDPFLMEVGEAEAYVERLESEKAERLAKCEILKKGEAARRTFWDEKISTCGIEGDYKDVKFQLKRMGVRCPEEIASP